MIKWDAIARVLRAGYSLLYADLDTVLLRDPFSLLSQDVDAEALSYQYAAPAAALYGVHAWDRCVLSIWPAARRSRAFVCVGPYAGRPSHQ